MVMLQGQRDEMLPELLGDKTVPTEPGRGQDLPTSHFLQLRMDTVTGATPEGWYRTPGWGLI